ncbi:secondary thiamine-phosphate synthase enzyme [Rhodobium orientis]|uniref:Secondary thiamine-phosphate synthase enzyme n=1 Tax=Rhodobium orientis TaxID=34017 RepID=A0A327JVY0_9HYPH|nr:secondary thiamine-phosphate synthase enzyme [Rhodobium orientis]MBK5949175.1 secondary thiamine-phosphate synthase enzyme [Rhodobium orientis]RAI27348.1 secondary thiamine-phosphate synthase enzyme [Rhodobium orientis]
MYRTSRSDVTVDNAATTTTDTLRQAMTRMTVGTRGRGMTEITDAIDDWLSGVEAGDGLLTVFLRHTSASLTIQENADPDVQHDLLTSLDLLAPEDGPWIHTMEGPDDMPAHIKSALTDISLSIPVVGGRMDRGTWQGVYVVEHRARPHRRTVALHYLGS